MPDIDLIFRKACAKYNIVIGADPPKPDPKPNPEKEVTVSKKKTLYMWAQPIQEIVDLIADDGTGRGHTFDAELKITYKEKNNVRTVTHFSGWMMTNAAIYSEFGIDISDFKANEVMINDVFYYPPQFRSGEPTFVPSGSYYFSFQMDIAQVVPLSGVEANVRMVIDANGGEMKPFYSYYFQNLNFSF